MKRSPEIVNILRGGIEEMVLSDQRPEVNFTRFFNFDENRVTLRMEMANEQGDFILQFFQKNFGKEVTIRINKNQFLMMKQRRIQVFRWIQQGERSLDSFNPSD